MKLSMLVSAGLAAALAVGCSDGGGGRDGADDGVDAPHDGDVAGDGDAFDQPDEALHDPDFDIPDAEDGPNPPRHVIATQGPTDPGRLYVWVTWDRSDPTATGYQVLRDGELVATVEVTGDPWDDMAFKDAPVAAGSHGYTVRAVGADGAGPPSAAYTVLVKTDADFGEIYDVDSFPGETDMARIQAAVDAALAAGGGVVRFSARTYELSDTLSITGDSIVLRGAGIDQTFIQPSFDGYSGGDDCPSGTRIIEMRAEQTSLGARAAADIPAGARTVEVTSAEGLAVGQVILLSETHPETELPEFVSQGVVADPGTGSDDRYRHEHNEIVGIDGSAVTFKFPFAHPFSQAVEWQLYEHGLHNRIEMMTVQGRGADERTYYDALTLFGADGAVAEVRVRWMNRRAAEMSGYDLRLVEFQMTEGGPNGVEGICRYKVQFWRATRGLVVASTFGAPELQTNQSMVTIQQAVRIVVRSSSFHYSRTYGVNEHGEGSPGLVIENNYFSVGAYDGACAVVLGNTTWGFSGPIIIRNNTFENNRADVNVSQNSYEARILDNISRGGQVWFLRAQAWAGPMTPEDLFGSMRMTIARNRVESGTYGLLLGRDDGIYPYAGIKDVIVRENLLQVTEEAILLDGSSSETNRFQVSGNSGSALYVLPELVEGDYWSGNADGTTYGSPTDVPWSAESFDWEACDVN